MKWRIKSRGLFFRADEDTVVYYDTYTGDTHLISEFAATLIDIVPVEGADCKQLYQRVLPLLDEAEAGRLQQDVEAVLEELADIDILWRC